MGKPEDRARDRQSAVLEILSNLKGIDPLKELFWNQLNYDRVNQSVSRKGWNETASKALADDPLIFAGGGENNDFKVILARRRMCKISWTLLKERRDFYETFPGRSAVRLTAAA
jgi:hypothetical protein